jgi:hypothetical protein
VGDRVMKTKIKPGDLVSVKLNSTVSRVIFSSLVDLEQKIIVHSISESIIASVWRPVNNLTMLRRIL